MSSGPGDLLDRAAMHSRHLIRDRLVLIMRRVRRGDAPFALHQADLLPNLGARPRV